jgi:hypothetical protein
MAGSGKANKGKARKGGVKGKKTSPGLVIIGPYTYKITYGPIDDGENWGKISHGDQVIQVDDSGDSARTSVVLMHEILHAVVNEHDLLGDEKTEERVVNVLSMMLGKVFMDNPKVMKFIMEGLT